MILVTGGTGMLGSHLLLKLLSSGEKVRSLYRRENLHQVLEVFSYYHSKNEAQELFEKIDWVKADILDIPALTDAFENIDYVYHCAALVSFDISDTKLLRKINIEGTANVVNLCISTEVKKLCFVSSIATLNKSLGSDEITEESHWNPSVFHTEYAITKYGAEMEIWRGTQEGVDAVIVHPGIILGPGHGESAEIFSTVKNGLKYHFPKVTGFVGVQDVARAIIELMKLETKNQQFILVSENKSFKEVLTTTATAMSKDVPSKSLQPWMVKTGWILQVVFGFMKGNRKLSRNSSYSLFEKSFYNNEKIKKQLSFQFEPIDEVIKNSAGFYLEK